METKTQSPIAVLDAALDQLEVRGGGWRLDDARVALAQVEAVYAEVEALKAENKRLREQVAEYVAQSKQRQENSLRRLP